MFEIVALLGDEAPPITDGVCQCRFPVNGAWFFVKGSPYGVVLEVYQAQPDDETPPGKIVATAMLDVHNDRVCWRRWDDTADQEGDVSDVTFLVPSVDAWLERARGRGWREDEAERPVESGSSGRGRPTPVTSCALPCVFRLRDDAHPARGVWLCVLPYQGGVAFTAFGQPPALPASALQCMCAATVAADGDSVWTEAWNEAAVLGEGRSLRELLVTSVAFWEPRDREE